MADSTKKSDKYKRLADYLQRQRRNKRLSVRKVALLAHIPDSTVRALEHPNKSQLPSSNVEGLYRLYGEALDVPAKRINDLLGEKEVVPMTLRVLPLPKLKSLIVFSNITTRIIAVLSVAILAIYAAWQGFGLVTTPRLEVSFPTDENMIVTSSRIDVMGRAQAESTILINGEPVPLSSEDNTFTQPVFLQAGFNRITIEASNNFSRSSQRDFNITYQPD